MIPVVCYRTTALVCRCRLQITAATLWRLHQHLRYDLLLGLTVKAALRDILLRSSDFAPLALAFVSCSGLGRLNRSRQFEGGQAGILLLVTLVVIVVVAGERVGQVVAGAALVLASWKDLTQLAQVSWAVDRLQQHVLYRRTSSVLRLAAECGVAPAVDEVDQALVLEQLAARGPLGRVNGQQAFDYGA